MPYRLLQGGRRRRRWRLRTALLVLLLATAGGLYAAIPTAEPPRRPAPQRRGPARRRCWTPGRRRWPAAARRPRRSPCASRIRATACSIRFKRPPRSALLFDLNTGRVLWRRDPTRVLPIASLTKMMTALVVVERVPPGSKVRVTKEALRYRGSGVGLLPRGKWIGVNTMLHGLLLPSGNDAAIALAQRAAGGSERRFVRYMNEKAEEMGLLCTRFCLLERDRRPRQPLVRRATSRRSPAPCCASRGWRGSCAGRSAVLPFPIKGGRLWLYNNNPLVRQGYPGITGVKTGYTEAAGRCLVATARRGSIRLGVVLLDSPDPAKQARQLLDRGFKAV